MVRDKHLLAFASKFFVLLFLFTGTGCATVPKRADKTTILRSDSGLKADVDYVYKKLQKFHPKLDWYITREELDFKFDSLKSTIQHPMTSNEFYLKISPVISSIKQGHVFLFPMLSKELRKELRSKTRRESSPLAPLDFEIFDDKLFIVKNNSIDPEIKTGSEVISMNDCDPGEIITIYSPTFSSDGFNQTYTHHRLSKEFAAYYLLHTGVSDSIQYQLKYNDTLSQVCLTRTPKHSKNKIIENFTDSDNMTGNWKKIDPDSSGLPKPPEFANGYIKFLGDDFETALIKIDRFSGQRYYSFLKYCFTLLQSQKTKNLILDLRDNPGGSAAASSKLYSYLTSGDYIFLEEMDVTSRTSILHTPYFVAARPLWAKAVLVVYLPFRLIDQGIDYFKVRKRNDGTFFYSSGLSKPSTPNPIHYSGKLYVLINGASFSASCILSSNLKATDRAVFVGEETGGAYNGTVAGKFSVFKLPASKLNILFGLAVVKPPYQTQPEGRGIFPDIEIVPTLKDRISGIDPEMAWILDDIVNMQR